MCTLLIANTKAFKESSKFPNFTSQVANSFLISSVFDQLNMLCRVPFSSYSPSQHNMTEEYHNPFSRTMGASEVGSIVWLSQW